MSDKLNVLFSHYYKFILVIHYGFILATILLFSSNITTSLRFHYLDLVL